MDAPAIRWKELSTCRFELAHGFLFDRDDLESNAALRRASRLVFRASIGSERYPHVALIGQSSSEYLDYLSAVGYSIRPQGSPRRFGAQKTAESFPNAEEFLGWIHSWDESRRRNERGSGANALVWFTDESVDWREIPGNALKALEELLVIGRFHRCAVFGAWYRLPRRWGRHLDLCFYAGETVAQSWQRCWKPPGATPWPPPSTKGVKVVNLTGQGNVRPTVHRLDLVDAEEEFGFFRVDCPNDIFNADLFGRLQLADVPTNGVREDSFLDPIYDNDDAWIAVVSELLEGNRATDLDRHFVWAASRQVCRAWRRIADLCNPARKALMSRRRTVFRGGCVAACRLHWGISLLQCDSVKRNIEDESQIRFSCDPS